MSLKFGRIPNSPLATAKNLSLWLPILGSGKVLRTRFQTLLGEYHKARLKILHEAGYFGERSIARRRLLASCPSPYQLVGDGEERMTCRRYTHCPFCWVRLITADCYLRFERLLFSDNRGTRAGSIRREAKAQHHLFEYAEHRFADSDDVAEVFRVEQAGLTQLKSHFRKALGVFYLTTVEPTRNGRLKIHHRVLAVVPTRLPDYSLPEEVDGVVVHDRLLCPTREVLARAVGCACQYPAGLLQGPLDVSLLILRQRAGGRGRTPRLSSYHGGLRGPIRQEEQDAEVHG